MSCRETAAGSAFTTWARLHENSGLSDVVTLSLFHELRRQYNAMPEATRPSKTDSDYQALLSRQINRVRANTVINERTRLSLLSRLENARTQPMPDQAITHALFNITPQVRARANNLNAFYLDIASRRESTVEEIRQEFTRLSSGIQRGRANRGSYTQYQLDEIAHYGVGNEEGVRYAVSTLLEEVRLANAIIIETGNKRITMQPITNPNAQLVCTPTKALAHPELAKLRLIAAGYDPRNKRLEVKILDTETGLETEYAYTNVDSYLGGQEITSGRLNSGQSWNDSVRSRALYQYPSEAAKALAGIAPRCSACGQFAAPNHGCPMRVEPQVIHFRSGGGHRVQWRNQKISFEDQEVSVILPITTPLRDAYATGAVTLSGISTNIKYIIEGRYNSGIVSGSATAYQDSENNLKINTNNLACRCDDYYSSSACKHIDIFTKALGDKISPSARVSLAKMTPEGKQDFIKNFLKTSRGIAMTDWSLDKAKMKEASTTWIKNTEVLYSNDFESFLTVFNQVLKAKKERKKPVIPYMKDNALNGLATRESGQAFGVEIEYTIPSKLDTNAINQKIALALYEANLTPSTTRGRYHSAKNAGYLYDTHIDANGKGTWSLENDGSVNGEIVSPRMYDEPETWMKLEKVLTILAENGVKMSTKAGGHVHVGTGFYKGDPKKYTELAKLATQHEDVLYRLAADPIRGVHRGGHYARPMPSNIEGGFAKIGDVSSSSNRKGLSFTYVSGDKTDHPEFRIFDGTLDPGAVQAHIKLSVAMTHAAARIAGQGNTKRNRELLGEHYKRNQSLRKAVISSPEIIKDETSTFRSFLDTLFQRKEDKDQMIALFANTKWSKVF